MLTLVPLTVEPVFLKLIKGKYKSFVCLCSTGRAKVYELTKTHSVFFWFPWQNLSLFASLLKKTNRALFLEDSSVLCVDEDLIQEVI